MMRMSGLALLHPTHRSVSHFHDGGVATALLSSVYSGAFSHPSGAPTLEALVNPARLARFQIISLEVAGCREGDAERMHPSLSA